MADIGFVNPRFGLCESPIRTLLWRLVYPLPSPGKKSNQPSGCLPLLAALTPNEHQATLGDENLEAEDYLCQAG